MGKLYDHTSKRITGLNGDIMDIKLEKIADNVANVEPRCLCWNIKFFLYSDSAIVFPVLPPHYSIPQKKIN